MDMIITDKAVFSVTGDGLILDEIAPGVTVTEIIELTEVDIINIEDWKKNEN